MNEAAAKRKLRVAEPLILMGIRGSALISKVALSFYVAKFLDLQSLGYYGYLTGAAAVMPIMLGFGTIQKISRQIAAQGLPGSLHPLKRYWALTATLYVVLGLGAAGFFVFLRPTTDSAQLAVLIVSVLLLEHLNNDAYSILTSTRRPFFANIQIFVRAALWIYIYMSASYFVSELRNLTSLLICWLFGVLISFVIFLLGCEPRFIRNLLLSKRDPSDKRLPSFSLPLYVGDSVNAISLFLDRYLVGVFLGTESAGIYSFYSSVAFGAYNLANASVMQVMRPKLVKLYFDGRDYDYAQLHRECMNRSLLSAALLCSASAIVLSLTLTYIGSPKIANEVGISYVLLVGTIARIASDVQGYFFYTRAVDSTFAKTVVFAAVLLVTLNVMLIPTLGLYGAALAFLLTYASSYALRSRVIYRAQTT